MSIDDALHILEQAAHAYRGIKQDHDNLAMALDTIRKALPQKE
jgi:hypothetical protein